MKSFWVFLFGVISTSVFSQEMEMSQRINITSSNSEINSISGNGNFVLFTNDYTISGQPALLLSENKGGWQEAETLPNNVFSSNVNYLYGNSLSFDGQTLFLTSRRSGLAGSYDLHFSNRGANGWSATKSLSGQINSPMNEGSPYLTADGNYLYFIRCDKMTATTASGCKICRSTLNKGNWSKGEELEIELPSDQITNPRLFLDGKTMIFSAVAPGGIGGYDLFWTREENGKWSTPKPMLEINTPENDFSANPDWMGNSVYRSITKNGSRKVVRTFLKPDYQGIPSLLITHHIERQFSNGTVRLMVFDASTGEEIIMNNYGDDQYSFVLPAGRKYLMLVKPPFMKNKFHNELIDLVYLDRSDQYEVDIDLMALDNDYLFIDGLTILPESPYLEDKSTWLMKSILDFTRTNSDQHIVIEVVQSNYRQDSIKSADLTEVIVDTVEVEIPGIPEIVTDTLYMDSTFQVSIDTVETLVTEKRVSFTYHNDRLKKEVATLYGFLTENNINLSKVSIIGKQEEPAESKPDRFLRIYFRQDE